MKKDYTNQALITGSFAVSCTLLIIKILSIQIRDILLFNFHLRKSKWIQNIGFIMIATLLSCGIDFQSYAQCTGCTFNAPADGTNFNFNGSQTLCITANVTNLSWNMNGTGNKICLATGVVWNQPFGGNLQGGTVIEVYGTLNLGGSINVNGTPPNAIINVHAGATLNSSSGFGNGITINNDGIVNFTGTGNVDFVGSSVFNNSALGTLNALTTTNFHISGGATINNNGNIHIANIENEDGFINNTVAGVLVVDRNFNNHGDFQNVGDFQLPCNPLTGAAGATTCSFRVGDKGVGKTFVTNSCIKVMNANIVFDGPGTINAGIEIGSGYNLTINKTVTGTNGSFLVKGGISTINLSGGYVGTNMKFYDVNTAGNSFDNNFNVNTPSNFTVSSSAGCSNVIACTPPTNVTASSNSPVAEGGGVNLTSTSTGGTSYAWSGPNSFSSTLQNPTIAVATLATAGTYTVTVTSSGTCIATATTAMVITATTAVCSLLPPLLKITGLEYGSGFGNAPQSENFTLNGGANTTPENNIAGFHITSSNEGTFFAFCTEINQPLFPIQSPYTHEVNGTSNGFTASQANRLSQLMQAAGFDPITGFGSLGTIAKYVAMQMAVWNVIYDTDYSVSSGIFYSVTDNNGSKTIADSWLAIAQTITSPTVEVHQIHHSSGQDLIIPKPLPPISLTVNQPTCIGVNSPNNGSIIVVGFTTGQRYQYSTGTTFNNGSAIPANTTAIPSGGEIVSNLPNTTVTYTVRVYDAIDDACYTDKTIAIVGVSCACTPPTNVTASSNSPVTEGGSINLTSSSTGGTSYAWSGPNSFSSTLQNPTIAVATLATAGTYTVTVTSSGTCIATATTLVAITPTTAMCTPPTNVTASSNSPVTEGGAINLTSSSTGGTSYAWSGPNSFSSTLQNPMIAVTTLAMAGTYTVTITSSGTCIATATTLVAVLCSPPEISTTKVTQATCNGTTAKNNAKIEFTAINGNKYDIVLGATYTGTGTYSSATNISGGGGSKINIPNPVSSEQYTIRVYNGSNTCYIDKTVTLNATSCVFVCEPFKCVELKVKIN